MFFKKAIIGIGALFLVLLLLLSSSTLRGYFGKIPVECITSDLKEYTGRINSMNYWDDLDNKEWTYSVVKVKEGDSISFKNYGMVFMAFLTTYNNPQRGCSPDFCSTDNKHSERFSFHAGVHGIVVPKGANYLYFSRKVRGSDNTPRYLYVDYENVLEGVYPASVDSIFLNFPLNKQQVCIHHDSFCRDVTGKGWHIGSNGGSFFPLNYYSPRSDYIFRDDGFRISDGYLTNEQKVDVGEAIRLIEASLSEENLVELSFPPQDLTSERLVLNFIDFNTFESFLITRVANSIRIEFIKRIKGIENTSLILEQQIEGKALRFHFSDNQTDIYSDESKLTSCDFRLNPKQKYGLMVSNRMKYCYDFINVFRIMPYKEYNESRYIDQGISYTHAGITQGWVEDYSHTLDTKVTKGSPVSERYELRRNTVTDYTNDRVEKSFNYQLQTNLRKLVIDFDILVPKDYKKDESPDCIVQIHDRPDEDSLEVRSPYFAIRIQNNQFILTSQSIEKHEKYGFNVNKIIPLANCKLGEWTHFTIYLKEGYLLEHNPLTRITINGENVYESSDPNTNNNPRGGYVRYGIYKADWLKEKKSSTEKKVLYFDNFKVYM